MITKIEVGNQVLIGIDEVQEIVQNEGDYLLKGLTLSLRANEQNTVSFLETVFSGDIGNIKVYGKEQLPATEEGAEAEYGEETLLHEYTNYDGMKSIYYDVMHKRFTVSLSMSAANIADAKYQKLLAERDKLQQALDEMSLAMAEILGGGE